MASRAPTSRFALRLVFDQHLCDGAWWPENHRLNDQLAALSAFWPPARGAVARVLYSPPDWEDRPRGRRSITVIPPDTPHRDAQEVLDRVRGVAAVRASHDRTEPQSAGDNEGGHL